MVPASVQLLVPGSVDPLEVETTDRDRPAGRPVAVALSAEPGESSSVAETTTAGAIPSLYWTDRSVVVTTGTAWIVTSAPEMSKKTLPTASTLMRAFVVAAFGIVTDSDPSFAVARRARAGTSRRRRSRG